MSIDWEAIKSRWLDISQMNRDSALDALRVAVPDLMDALARLYRQYDTLVVQAQDGVMAASRQLATLQVMINELETQLTAMLKASMAPGGRVLHSLHDLCALSGVEYNSLFSGYRPIPKFSQNVLGKHRLSRPEFFVPYSSGDAELVGDTSTLYDGTDNTSVELRIRRNGLVQHEPNNAYIPQHYKGGAVAYICAKLYQNVPHNRLIIKTGEPVYLLGRGFESHNWLNYQNLWSDPNGSDAGWYRKDGSAATREWDSLVSRNVLTLRPDTLDSYISISPRTVVSPGGYVNHAITAHRCVYGLELSYLVQYAPVELTVTVYDSNGKAFISQSKVLPPGNGVSMLEQFFGASLPVNSFGISFSVKRVGNTVGKLWIRSIRVCDWLWIEDLNLPLSTTFDVPVYAGHVVPSVACAVIATPHVRVSDGLEYFCNIQRFELRNELYTGESAMISPQIPQSTHPISNVRVFVDGDNLENSTIIVGSDSTFTRSVQVPASEATAVGGVEVSFAPYITDPSQVSSLPGYVVPVPLQYVSESFTHGSEFTLRYVPYCHPLFLRGSMRRLGRYEPNFDLTEVDPSRLEELGVRVEGGLSRTTQTNHSDWTSFVLGNQQAVQATDNEYFIEGVLPGYDPGGVSVTDKRTDYRVFGVDISKDPSLFTVGTEVVNIPGGRTYYLMPSGSQYIYDYDNPSLSLAQNAYAFYPDVSGTASVVPSGGSATLTSYRIDTGAFVRSASLTNPLDRTALLMSGYFDSAGHRAVRRVGFPSHNYPGGTYRAFKLKRGRYRFSVTVGAPHSAVGTSEKTSVALNVWRAVKESYWSPQIVGSSSGVELARGQTSNIEYVLDVPVDDEVYWFELLVWGDAAIAFPALRADFPSAVVDTASADYVLTWSLPQAIAASQQLVLAFDTADINVRPTNRVELKRLNLSGFVTDGSGVPVIQAKAVINGSVVNLSNMQRQSFSAGTEGGEFVAVSWEIPSEGKMSAFMLELTTTSTANNKVLVLTLKKVDGNPHFQLVERITSYDPGNAPSNPVTLLRWSNADNPLQVGRNSAISFHVYLRGFQKDCLRVSVGGVVLPSQNVRITDDGFVDTDTPRVARVSIMPSVETVSAIEIIADSPLFPNDRIIHLGVDREWRISSVFDTLVPIKVTLIAPYGTFVPDVIGPVPVGGTRYVENERLELASDQMLEQYEQVMATGSVSRKISQDRPVYATMFAPLVINRIPLYGPQLRLHLYDRSSNSLVRTLSRREYIVDRERGLIQPLIDIPADKYLVADYRFRVTSEAQLKLYESKVRADLMTRNRTDYLFGSVPTLKPFRFGADEVRSYTVMEYYHQGNRLVLSEPVPPPIDATYAVNVSYWYLPVNPALKLVLRPTNEGRIPVVRKVVLQT